MTVQPLQNEQLPLISYHWTQKWPWHIYANENLGLLYLIPTKYIQLSPLFIIDYTSTSSPLIMSPPSSLKKWPYKRGDLSWGGQLNYQVFYYFCSSQLLPYKRVLRRGDYCIWKLYNCLFFNAIFLSHLAKVNVSFCHHLTSHVCRPLTFHILILVWSIYGRSSIKIGHFFPIR